MELEPVHLGETKDDDDDRGAMPLHFLCPISLEVMADPVTLCTGITYDRASISTWLNTTGHNTCPVTNQALATKDLLPNLVLRRLIRNWHRSSSCCSSSASSPTNNLPVHTPSCSPPPHQPELLKLIQQIEHGTAAGASTTTLQALHSIKFRLSIDHSRGNAYSFPLLQLGTIITALVDLLRNPDERVVCEKSLELLDMLLLSSPEARIEATKHANLIPAIVSNTMLGVSLASTKHSVHILCMLCVENEKCCSEAVTSGAIPKMLVVLQFAHTSTRTKKKAMELLKLFCRKRHSIPQVLYSQDTNKFNNRVETVA